MRWKVWEYYDVVHTPLVKKMLHLCAKSVMSMLKEQQLSSSPFANVADAKNGKLLTKKIFKKQSLYDQTLNKIKIFLLDYSLAYKVSK